MSGSKTRSTFAALVSVCHAVNLVKVRTKRQVNVLASKTMVKVYSLVWTLIKRLQRVIGGPHRSVLLYCALLQNCLAGLERSIWSLSNSQVCASAAANSGSGVVLAMLIFGLLMASMITQLTLPSAFLAQKPTTQWTDDHDQQALCSVSQLCQTIQNCVNLILI